MFFCLVGEAMGIGRGLIIERRVLLRGNKEYSIQEEQNKKPSYDSTRLFCLFGRVEKLKTKLRFCTFCHA